jgi:DNA-binding NarL/FixJ family response regulator
MEEPHGVTSVVQCFKILVVEDYEQFRRFVCSLLQQKPEYQITQASDGLEAVQKAKELQPDLIVLDIGLPGLNGLEAARRVRKFASGARVLFISQESSPEVVQEALILGARGYVHKSRAASDLIRAVEAVFRGEQFVSGGLIPALPSSLSSLNLRSALSQVLAQAIEMAGADMGSLHILDHQTNSLHIAAQSGFSRQFLEFFNKVQHHYQSACSTALSRGRRVIVDDVAHNPIFRGRSREIVLAEGVRAVQSVPLTTASGQLVGVLSTHFRVAKPPRQQLYQVTDAFAQKVAELIQSKLCAVS